MIYQRLVSTFAWLQAPLGDRTDTQDRAQHLPVAASSRTASAGWHRWSPEPSEGPWIADLGSNQEKGSGHGASFADQQPPENPTPTVECTMGSEGAAPSRSVPWE